MITSKTNEKVKYLTKLQTKKARSSEKKYIVSKPNIIEEAKKCNLDFETISTIDENSDYYVSKEVMAKITNDSFEEAIILPINETTIDYDQNTIVLDGVQDPGNMGTILRSALAFGITNVVLSENCVDIYNPKVISSMQGCHFYQTITYTNLGEFFETSTNTNIMTYLDEPKNISAKHNSNFNLVVGNEGNGIDKKYKKYMNENYLLDIKFESLNVAIASSIIMYELTKEK